MMILQVPAMILEVPSKILNPVSPSSDENEISLYISTTNSNIQVMRIKDVIPKD